MNDIKFNFNEIDITQNTPEQKIEQEQAQQEENSNQSERSAFSEFVRELSIKYHIGDIRNQDKMEEREEK